MNRKAQKCNCCSRRRKSADDIPTETIYLYCKPCCKPGTVHKTKCCETCSIFDAVPMCRRPSSEVDLPGVNIELLPGYNEPSNKIDRILRGLFNCENNDEDTDDIYNGFEEDATASVKPIATNVNPVLNNAQRTSWAKRVMTAQTSKENNQSAEVIKNNELKENVKSLKFEGAKNLAGNTTFDVFKKSESLNQFENLSKSSADSTRSRTFADIEIPANYHAFKPLQIPAEWKKPIQRDESVIWRTSKERNISEEVSKLVDARPLKIKETKTAAKPSQKSGGSKNTKSQMTTRDRKAEEQVESIVRKISDTTRNSVNVRKSGGCNSQEIVKTGNILSSTSSEEGIKTSKMVNRKKSKERETSDVSIVPEEKKNEDSPKSEELRNFPYSASSQYKMDEMKGRVEKIANFGNLDNSGSSKDLAEARSTQHIEKNEKLNISGEWRQPENLNVPIDIKESEGHLEEEVKMLKDLQKIAELISFLSKNSAEGKRRNRLSNYGSSKNLSSVNCSVKSANGTMKKFDQLKIGTEARKCDQISPGKSKPKVIPKTGNYCNCGCSKICKNKTDKEKIAAGKTPNSNLNHTPYLLSSKRAESSMETTEFVKLGTSISDEQPKDCQYSEHEVSVEVQTSEETQVTVVDEFKRPQEQKDEGFADMEKFEKSNNVLHLTKESINSTTPNSEIGKEKRNLEKFPGLENFSIFEGSETTQVLIDMEQVKEERKSDGLKKSDEAKNLENDESNIQELEEIPKSENFDNFVRLKSSEARTNLVDVNGIRHQYENFFDSCPMAKSSTNEMDPKNETSVGMHISNLLSVPNLDIKRTSKYIGHPEEISNLNSLNTYESLKNSENKTHIEIYKKEEVRTPDLCSSISSEHKKISYMDQTKPSSSITGLKIPASTSNSLAAVVKRTSTDIKKLEELRKPLTIQISEDLKESQMQVSAEIETYDLGASAHSASIKVKKTSTDLSQSSYIPNSVLSTDVESKRTWTDMSYSSELRKFETLEAADEIKRSKIPVLAEFQMYNLRRFPHTSSVDSKKTSRNLTKPDDPKIPEELKISVDLRESERHTSTEIQLSDTCRCSLPKKVKPNRTSIDESPLEELGKSEGLKTSRNLEQSEISIPTKAQSADILRDIGQSEIRIPTDTQPYYIRCSVFSTTVEAKKTWTDMSQTAKITKSESSEGMKESEIPVSAEVQVYNPPRFAHSSSVESKRTSKDLSKPEDLRTPKDPETPVHLGESEIHTSTEEQAFDTCRCILSTKDGAKRASIDISPLGQVRKSEGFKTSGGLGESNLSIPTKTQSSDIMADFRQSEIRIPTESQPYDIHCSVFSKTAEQIKSEGLETSEEIKENKIPVLAEMQVYNATRSAISSSVEPKRTSKDLSKPEDLRPLEELNTPVDLEESEIHTSTEDQAFSTCRCILSTKDRAKRTSVDISPLEEVRKSEGLKISGALGESEMFIPTKTQSSDILRDIRQSEIPIPTDTQSYDIRCSVFSTTAEAKKTWSELNQPEESSKTIGMVEDICRCTRNLKTPEDLKTTMDELQTYEMLRSTDPSNGVTKNQSGNLTNFKDFEIPEKLSESKIRNPIEMQSSDIAHTVLSSNAEAERFGAEIRQESELREFEGLGIIDPLKESENSVAEIMEEYVLWDSAHSLSAETKRTSTDLNQSEELKKPEDLKNSGMLRVNEGHISSEIRPCDICRIDTVQATELSKSEVMLEDLKNFPVPGEIQACNLQQSARSSIVETERTSAITSQSEELKELEVRQTSQKLENSETRRKNEISELKDSETPILWSSVSSAISQGKALLGQEVTNLWKASPSSSSQIYRSTEQIGTLEDFDICEWIQNSNDEFGNTESRLVHMQTAHLGESLHAERSEDFKISESLDNVHRSKASKMQADSSRLLLLSSSKEKKTSSGQRKRSKNKVDKSSIQILQPKELRNQVHSTSLDQPTYSGEKEKSAVWGNPEAWRRVRNSELYGKVKNSKDEIEKRVKKLTKPLTSRRVQPEKQNFKDQGDLHVAEGWNNQVENKLKSREMEIPVVTRKPGWKKLEPWENCDELKKTKNVKYKKNNTNLMKLNKNIIYTTTSGEANEPYTGLRKEQKIPSDESTVSTEVAQSCECRKIETWIKSKEEKGRSVICSQDARTSMNLRGPVEVRKSVKYKKYSNWRVSSEAKQEIEKVEKIKLSKKVWNYLYLVPSEGKLHQESRKRENILKSRNMPKYFCPTNSTDCKISSCDSRQLQNWRKPRNWENSEKKIKRASNKSAELAKPGKASNWFSSTTSDDTSISMRISEWRKPSGLKLGSVMQKAQSGRDKEVKQLCGCTTSSDYSTAERKSAGMEEFPALGSTMSNNPKPFDSSSDKKATKIQSDPKAEELWYYFRVPSSEDARNSIATQFGGAKNSLVDNQSGQPISETLVRCTKPRKIKYWAIPRHLTIPGNFATLESFGLGKFEKLRKPTDSEALKAPIILKGFSQQENREVSVNADEVSEDARCERNFEDVCEGKFVGVNDDVPNIGMHQGNYWKDKEIREQQGLNLEPILIRTKDSQDIGCKTSDDKLKVERLSKQSLTAGQKLCATAENIAAQEDTGGKIMLIERMSGGGEMHDDTEEEEEEELQEQIYDENLYAKKLKKRRNFTASAGTSAGCNSFERRSTTEQDERIRGSSHGCRRNEARNQAGENVRMRYTGSPRGRINADNDDVDLVEQVQNNVTRRITSSGDIVEVCETVRYAKVFKNSHENLNSRTEYPNCNSCQIECGPCEMQCSCCCCRHNDYCSDLNCSCCECDEYKSDCDSRHAILTDAPSLCYLNKHDEYIVPDKHGMNKLKSFESEEDEEEAFGMEDPAEPSHRPNGATGAKRISGATGTSGASKASGANRANGASRASGASRPSGASKTSGTSAGKVGTTEISAETYHRTKEESAVNAKESQISTSNSRDSLKDVDSKEADRSPAEGDKANNIVQNEAEDSQKNRSNDGEKNPEEPNNQEPIAAPPQETISSQTSNNENSGSIEGPDFYNCYSKLRTSSTQFQQREMRRHCRAVSGRMCFCKGCTEEVGCRIVKLGPMIGSRKIDKIPDEMGIMKPIKRISSTNRFESKQNYPASRNRGGELDSRRDDATRREKTIPEIKNNHPTNHQSIHREGRIYRRIDDNSRVFSSKKKIYPADQINSFERDFEPHTNDRHYSSTSDRDHRRRFSAGGKVRDHSTEDQGYFYNNEHELSSEEIDHFESEPSAVVNILAEGRGQVFGYDMKNVYYSPTNRHAISSSIISVSTHRRKYLKPIDEKIYYHRDRQVSRSRSYESFHQPSSARYEESENLQMRNRRLGGGADRPDFEVDECYDCDSRELCCRKRYEPRPGCDIVPTPKNKAQNCNQRTRNVQQMNGPKMRHCRVEYAAVGGAKRKNITVRRDSYGNGPDFRHYNKNERSDQDNKRFMLYDTEGLPDEFFLSQTDCSMFQNNDNAFHVDNEINENNNNRLPQMRGHNDPLLESWSRERTNFDERKYINDEMFRRKNNDILIRRKNNASNSPALNNGFQRTFRSERGYPDHRIEAGGPKETDFYFADGPAHEHRGQNYRSDREDFYIKNNIDSTTRRNPAYQNITNDSYFDRADNSTRRRQKDAHYRLENAIPFSVNGRLDRNTFPESRNDAGLRVSSYDLVDCERKTCGRTFRNEENFDTRRNYVGASQCIGGRRTPRNEERLNCLKEQCININENHGSDFHLEGYYHLELGEDDPADRRIVVDDDGNIYDLPIQHINNEIRSNVQDPMQCYHKKAIIDNNGCMFYYKKVLNNDETSVFSVIEPKSHKPKHKLANPKKHNFEDGRISRGKTRITKPNGHLFHNRRESIETGKIPRPTPPRRLAGGRSGSDDPRYYNSNSSAGDPRRELRRQISTIEPFTYSSNLDVRNQHRARGNIESIRSDLSIWTKNNRPNNTFSLLNVVDPAREKQRRLGVRRREDKFERSIDDLSTFSEYENARSRRRKGPPSCKKTTNVNRESSITNVFSNVRKRAGNHNGVRRTQNFDEETSFNTEGSFDGAKSNISIAPHYGIHNDGSLSQTRLGDTSLIDERCLSSRRGDEHTRLEEKSNKVCSYKERRNCCDEQTLYNKKRLENQTEEDCSVKLGAPALDTTTVSQNSTDQKSNTCNHEDNRRLNYHNKKYKCCACQCHKLKKNCTCKSKKLTENVPPILTKWLQEPTETPKETKKVISRDSISKKNIPEDSRPKEQLPHSNREPHCCCRCPKSAPHNEACKGYKGCCGYYPDMQRLRDNRQYAWNYGSCLHKANYLTQLPHNYYCNCIGHPAPIPLGCTGCNNIRLPLTQGFYDYI